MLKWVKVSEHLPDEHEPVFLIKEEIHSIKEADIGYLVTSDDGNLQGFYIDNNTKVVKIESRLAWMYLVTINSTAKERNYSFPPRIPLDPYHTLLIETVCDFVCIPKTKACKYLIYRPFNVSTVLQPVLNSHIFLNDLAELATMQEFLNSTSLGRDFKRKYQRKYTDQESKKRPLSTIWQESGLRFYDSKNQ